MAFNFAFQSVGMIKIRTLQTCNLKFISVFKKSLHFFKENKLTDNLNITEKSHENIDFEKINILSEALGISIANSLQIVVKNKRVLCKDNEHLERVSSFLIDKFDVKDILKNPRVLTIAATVSEEHYSILKELGFPTSEITPSILSLFSSLLLKNTRELKSLGLIPSSVDPLQNMLSLTHANEGLIANIKDTLNYLCKDHNIISVRRLRHIVLCCLLADKLDLTLEAVFKVTESYKAIKNRSLSSLLRTLERLKEVGFTNQKITSNMNLATGNFYKLNTFLELKELNGIPVTELMAKNPTMLTADPKHVIEVAKILEDNKITKTQIRETPRIHNLSPKTVLARLEAINQIPEFRLLKFSPFFLKLVINYHTAEARLSELTSQGYNSISLNSLTCSNRLHSLKMVYGGDKSWGRDLIYYLNDLFNTSYDVTKRQLLSHPKSKSSFNLVNADRVANYLLESGVTKEQLWDGLPVVLYNYNLVTKTFLKMETLPELQPFSEWRYHPLRLDLLIYYIEKPNRFTGEGVFKRQ